MTKFQEKYYNFWYSIFANKITTKFKKIDFHKPWYSIYTLNFWGFLPGIINELGGSILAVLAPVIVAQAFNNQNLNTLLIFLFISAFWNLLGYFLLGGWFWVRTAENINASLIYSINNKILEVDPTFHATKDSGQIISKAYRGVAEAGNIIFLFTWEIFPLISDMIIVIITLLAFNFVLGGITSIVIIFFAIGIIIFLNFNAKVLEAKRIPLQDKQKSIEVENLQQTQYIRSLFATPEQSTRISDSLNRLRKHNYTSWRSGSFIWTFFYFIYGLLTSFVGIYIFNRIEIGEFNTAQGLALFSTFLIGTNQIVQIGNQFERFVTAKEGVKDMFDFMKNYGQQTYPVLEEESEKT